MSTEWLAAHLDQPSLRILDCSVVMRTAEDGSYSFVGRIDAPGEYRVRLVPPPGWRLTTADTISVHVTRGEAFRDLDFGVFPDII